MPRTVLLAIGWGVVALVAVALTGVALSHVGSTGSARGLAPLSEQEVRAHLDAERALSGAPTTSAPDPGGTGTAVAGPTDSGPPVTTQVTGGSVIAECRNGLARLVSWSPSPGYESDDEHRGPAPAASIEFEIDDAPDTRVVVTCDAARAVINAVPDDD